MKSRLTQVFRALEAELAQPPMPDAYTFGEENAYSIRVAASAEDRRRAWALAYGVYLSKEYAEPNRQRLWYTLHDALPDTTTFLVEKGGQAVAALTLVFDSPLGLPADDIYHDRLDDLRRQGRRLCEIVSLVSVESDLRKGVQVMKHMFKLAYLTAHHLEDATDFVITVNPRHVSFYERTLLFERAGEERLYSKVGGAPAVLLRLDLVAAWDAYRERFDGLPGERNLYRFFIDGSERLRAWLRRARRPLNRHSLQRYFVEERPLLAEAVPGARHYVEECYLAYDLSPAVL